MTERREYEMTDADLAEILEACKPAPVLFLSGGTPMFPTPQENANAAWRRLGARMGFDAMTVQPVPGKGQRVFTAMPKPPERTAAERKAELLSWFADVDLAAYSLAALEAAYEALVSDSAEPTT